MLEAWRGQAAINNVSDVRPRSGAAGTLAMKGKGAGVARCPVPEARVWPTDCSQLGTAPIPEGWGQAPVQTHTKTSHASAPAHFLNEDRQQPQDTTDRATMSTGSRPWGREQYRRTETATEKVPHGTGKQEHKTSLPTPKSQQASAPFIFDPNNETNMVWEHGRRYCRDYFMPNDEDEQDRLRILHQIYLNIFHLELTTIPLDNPTMVLDVGTGTGEWAMAIAEQWPECEVIGVDISPTFEQAIPLNCNFRVMDGEDPWPWPDSSFDMVHYRHMSGTFRDWTAVYGETLRCLKPGGWVEILEFHDHEGEKTFYDRFPPGSVLYQAARDIEKAEAKHGKHRGIDHMAPELLEGSGFTDCQVYEHIIPLNVSNSPLGKLWLVTLRAGFESYGLRLLTTYMGWDASAVRMACDSIGQQMMAMATDPHLNRDFHVRLRVTIARKPCAAPSRAAASILPPSCSRPHSQTSSISQLL